MKSRDIGFALLGATAACTVNILPTLAKDTLEDFSMDIERMPRINQSISPSVQASVNEILSPYEGDGKVFQELETKALSGVRVACDVNSGSLMHAKIERGEENTTNHLGQYLPGNLDVNKNKIDCMQATSVGYNIDGPCTIIYGEAFLKENWPDHTAINISFTCNNSIYE